LTLFGLPVFHFLFALAGGAGLAWALAAA